MNISKSQARRIGISFSKALWPLEKTTDLKCVKKLEVLNKNKIVAKNVFDDVLEESWEPND